MGYLGPNNRRYESKRLAIVTTLGAAFGLFLGWWRSKPWKGKP